MKIALYTPLPPDRTGVAHYASLLIPALREAADVEIITNNQQPTTDNRVYQLGNNPHHEFAYRQALETPGVAVLHDVVLHHLIVEMTLARGDGDAYVETLRANHGEAGAAWARGRVAGLHSEMGNFLFPASIEVARRSRAVIVHNRWAADLLVSFGVETPIHVVPHPHVPQSHGAKGGERAIGLFGFLTSAKRAEVVVEAFHRARKRDPRLHLLVVGEAAPNIDMSSIAGQGVTITGYVPDEEFGAYYGKVDRIVNLRYPTAGETSGTLIRAFEAGKPVAVSDYAQFAEYPDDIVAKIPLGGGEIEALVEFMTADPPDVADAQRRWLETNARLDQTVEGYLRAVAAEPPHSRAAASPPPAGIALFPNLTILRAEGHGSTLHVTLRNDGHSTILTRLYGQPAYRAVMNGRWLELPRDLRPGESVELQMPLYDAATTVRLTHGLESIPIVDQKPSAVAEIHRVR
jgi:glycosyltransferase involved in cell wall biosynthesis